MGLPADLQTACHRPLFSHWIPDKNLSNVAPLLNSLASLSSPIPAVHHNHRSQEASDCFLLCNVRTRGTFVQFRDLVVPSPLPPCFCQGCVLLQGIRCPCP